MAILPLGNLQFGEADARNVSAYVANQLVLDQVARLLGVPSEDLSEIFTNKTSYVRKELYTVMMSAQQSSLQRDKLAKDLYDLRGSRRRPITRLRWARRRLLHSDHPLRPARIPVQGFAPGGIRLLWRPCTWPSESSWIRGVLRQLFERATSLYILRDTFELEDSVGYNSQLTGDGVSLPPISVMDKVGCVELLRGAQ